jgi:hypothetical protein
LRDIIRHECGYAFAHYYPNLIIRGKEFRRVFSGHYYANEPSKVYDSASYFSSFAQTCPMEDFAEKFMVYVKGHGNLLKNMNERLESKWNYIRLIAGLSIKI